MSLTTKHIRGHERTRRRVCLVAFVTFGFLPTVVVAGWCLSRHLPGTEQKAALQLQQHLGLGVRLTKLVYVCPGVVRYEGLALLEPESNQPMLHCRWVEVRRGKSARSSQRPLLEVIAEGAVVDAAALMSCRRWLQYLLENRLPLSDVEVRISAAEIGLAATAGDLKLCDVSSEIKSLPAGTEAQVCFRLSGNDQPEPVKLRLLRDRRTTPPLTLCEFSTGSSELPCRLLALGLPGLQAFGSRSRFRGYIWGTETPYGWEGDVAGRVTGLDLGALVSRCLPYRISGTGELTIHRARFQHGRLQEGNGMLVAGPGKIDRALLAAAITYLDLQTTDQALLRAAGDGFQDQQTPFRQLALAVSLSAEGLQLAGQCNEAPPGTILYGEHQVLLADAQHRIHPITALVQLLAPAGARQALGVSRQGEWLLRHLPLPEAGRLPLAEPLLPTAGRSRLENREIYQR